MGTIDRGRVILGGLVAGVVLNIGEYVLNGVLLREKWDAAMTELGFDTYGAAEIGIMVLLMFVLGLVLVWTYAAVRPRFSPGPRAAVIAGLLGWLLLYAFPFIYNSLVPVFPSDLMLITTVWGFFELPIATMVGAFFYAEDDTAP
ncbi:MAG: hypothetical protein R3326_00180 [Gemmatimonadota bacterium]|nr:hypothetical protein [Gemmatimonadota bacterium]